MRPLAFELLPREFLENSGILWKIVENRQKFKFRYLEKGGLELRLAATLKPRKIDPSGFFYWTTTDKLEFTD